MAWPTAPALWPRKPEEASAPVVTACSLTVGVIGWPEEHVGWCKFLDDGHAGVVQGVAAATRLAGRFCTGKH